VFALANFLWAIGDVAIGSIDWEENDDTASDENMLQIDDTQLLGTAVLLLPGSNYTDKTRSVISTQFNLTLHEFQQLVAERNAKTHIYFLEADSNVDTKLAELIGSK